MSPLRVDVANVQDVLPVSIRQLRRAVRHVLQSHGVPTAVVSVVVAENAALRRLKRRYFGRNVITDVISFDFRDDPRDKRLDCEIVINAQRAEKIAAQRGTDPFAELNLYLVHGLLHQLGYDDRRPRAAHAMHAREDQLLAELGFGPVYARTK